MGIKGAVTWLCEQVDGHAQKNPGAPAIIEIAKTLQEELVYLKAKDFIIDGVRAFPSLWMEALKDSSLSKPQQEEKFVHLIINTVVQLQRKLDFYFNTFVVFDHPEDRPDLKKELLAMRLYSELKKKTRVDDKPFLASISNFFAVTEPQAWTVAFNPQGDPTPQEVARFRKFDGNVTFVVSSLEADVLVSASTRFGWLCDHSLTPSATVLRSHDADWLVLLGSDRARLRSHTRAAAKDILLLDLLELDQIPNMVHSNARQMAGLVGGTDYTFSGQSWGVHGLGFRLLCSTYIGGDEKVLEYETWSQGADHATMVLKDSSLKSRLNFENEDVKSSIEYVCKVIGQAMDLLDFGQGPVVHKSDIQAKALAQGSSKVCFSGSKCFKGDRLVNSEPSSNLVVRHSFDGQEKEDDFYMATDNPSPQRRFLTQGVQISCNPGQVLASPEKDLRIGQVISDGQQIVAIKQEYLVR